jgi:hypothetical protein
VKRPVGILYEHPRWFEPLFAELAARGIEFEKLHAASLSYEPGHVADRWSLVVNRMSPSAWTRGHGNAIFSSLHFLDQLDAAGVPTLNGLGPYRYELSKARQYALFAQLGVRHPATRVVNSHAAAVEAARELRFPLLVKPNIGGSGAGIESFASIEELQAATLDFGLDGTGLVQERLAPRDGHIVRVEILDGELLYAIRIRLEGDGFNLCPADYCELPGIADGVSGRGLPIEAYTPPDGIVGEARRIVRAAGMDVAGIEYLVAEDGNAYFYDLNSLSNFVADATAVVGFDPFVDLVDLVERLAGEPSAVGV